MVWLPYDKKSTHFAMVVKSICDTKSLLPRLKSLAKDLQGANNASKLLTFEHSVFQETCFCGLNFWEGKIVHTHAAEKGEFHYDSIVRIIVKR